MTKPDPQEVAITLAFLAIGFEDAHRASDEAGSDLGDQHASNHGGHIRIVADLYDYAEYIEECLTIYDDAEYPGVVHYEVTEPLGRWLFNNPDAFTEPLSDSFAEHASDTIDRWFNPAAPAAQPETSTMKLSELIRQLQAVQSRSDVDLDVLTRGSEPQKMVDATDVRTVKTAKRTAVFIGKPKPGND